VGVCVGSTVGISVGVCVGSTVGISVGVCVGSTVGISVGAFLYMIKPSAPAGYNFTEGSPGGVLHSVSVPSQAL